MEVYFSLWRSSMAPTELKGAEAELEAQTHNLTEARERWNAEGRPKHTVHIFRS